ncbi:hypothetical protein HEQ60_10035 [Haematospirillum sp. H1815]|uniref:hypothetical protein n=1 Tax=Haematospirillum sp. H1815 TaxID=2723108 RepID=UPI00143922DF|nr:hypothetical protein [Haematospirillum sp. H1815]NKD78097.1 hypothetical protein [Haematospirillum sp. H1815]
MISEPPNPQFALLPERHLQYDLFICDVADAVLKDQQPAHCQTWRILLSHVGVQALCEFPQVYLAFDRNTFSSDPRLNGMDWERKPVR